MVKIKLLSIAIIFTFSGAVCAQNTLWLANGKKKEIGEYKLEKKDFVIYKNKKGKFKSIEKFDVYSIIEESKKEVIVYKPDSVDNESFTLTEMKAFVQGQYDANQHFKSLLSSIGGIGVAAASSLLINPLYTPIVSGVYCGVIGSTKASEKKIIIPNEFTNSDHYLLGYKKATKRKRIKNAILGSAIGLAAGFATFVIINQ